MKIVYTTTGESSTVKESIVEIFRMLGFDVSVKEEKKEEKPVKEGFDSQLFTEVMEKLTGIPYCLQGEWLGEHVPDAGGFPMILYAAAVTMDLKYKNHIKDADVEFYWSINMANGTAYKVPKKSVVTYKMIPLFRSLEDLKAATAYLKPVMKQLWPNGK